MGDSKRKWGNFFKKESLEELRLRMQEEQPSQTEQPLEQSEQAKSEKAKKNVLKELWLFLRPAVICCAVILIINQLFLLYAVVPTGSMKPLLEPNSYIFANRRAYDTAQPQRGDVVVFESKESKSNFMVKRIIAVGGDTVELINGEVYLNGTLLDESKYAVGKTFPNYSGERFTVPEGFVFLLGDNRENSADSRYWSEPYVPVEKICGRVFFTFSLVDWYARGVDSTFGTPVPVG